MKPTLATALIVLFIACLLKWDTSFSPQAQVNAQPPTDVKEEPLTRAIDRYLEQERDRKQRPDKPEQNARQREREAIGALPERPDQQMHHRDRERMHEAHRDWVHNLEQQKHRIEKMHLAAKSLNEAGLPDMAHQIHRQAEEQEVHVREQLENAKRLGHRLPPHPPEIRELLHQLQNEIRELKKEVHELREIVSARSEKSER